MTLKIFNPDDPGQPQSTPPPFAVCARCTHYDGDWAEYRLQLCKHPENARRPATHPVSGADCFTDGTGFYEMQHPPADTTNPRGKCEKFSPSAIDSEQ